MSSDIANIVKRLRSVLPLRWFSDHTPVLDSVLSGIAAGWVVLFDFVQYTQNQTRIGSASGIWLDLVAQDFFGSDLQRHSGQSDEALHGTIKSNILRPRATRASLTSALTDLTGRAPHVFEPRNTSDTGGYATLAFSHSESGGGLGYGNGGGWGNLTLPFQCFITAFRPHVNGVATVSGWGVFTAGYGLGQLEYADMDIILSHVSDADILKEITRVLPVGVVAWTKIVS